MRGLEKDLKAAVKQFWTTRESQLLKQGAQENRDRGFRSAVTGGKQMDGFVQAVKNELIRVGLDHPCIYVANGTELPGYFRPEKRWDVVVVVEGKLVACIEFKSQVGPSFGNNYNNRSEEAIGNATDLWTAFREGAFRFDERPWLGYMMLLEETTKSMTPVGVREPHFSVFEEYRGASYAKRSELLLSRLVRERLYDAACLLMSTAEKGIRGGFRQPLEGLSFQKFVASLCGHALAMTKLAR